MPRVRISLHRARPLAGGWLLAGLVILAGCGGQDEAAPPPAKPLVPAALQQTSPVDSLVAPTDTVPKSEAVPAVLAPAATPPAPKVPVEKAPAVTGEGPYSLQLGSFRSEANAQAQISRLRELGFGPVLEKADIGGSAYYRVLLPNLETREKAAAVGEKIRTALGTEYLVRRTD